VEPFFDELLHVCLVLAQWDRNLESDLSCGKGLRGVSFVGVLLEEVANLFSIVATRLSIEKLT
jgi:hypothetical protein